jgi:hypothetical protein
MHVFGRPHSGLRGELDGTEELVQLDDEAFGRNPQKHLDVEVRPGDPDDNLSDEEASDAGSNAGAAYDVGSSSGDCQPNMLSGAPQTTSPRRTSVSHREERPPSVGSSWYEFDLSVVVALISPIGNWLTGGDHIKNLLLLLFLIFYLHQIIESKLHYTVFCFELIIIRST